jgi:hypothetical protein
VPKLFDRNGGCEDFLIEGRHGGPPVGPDGVDRAVHGGDALVVSVRAATLELLAEGGYARLTMDQVAVRARVSKSSECAAKFSGPDP